MWAWDYIFSLNCISGKLCFLDEKKILPDISIEMKLFTFFSSFYYSFSYSYYLHFFSFQFESLLLFIFIFLSVLPFLIFRYDILIFYFTFPLLLLIRLVRMSISVDIYSCVNIHILCMCIFHLTLPECSFNDTSEKFNKRTKGLFWDAGGWWNWKTNLERIPLFGSFSLIWVQPPKTSGYFQLHRHDR